MSHKATASKTTDSKSSNPPVSAGRTVVHSQVSPQEQFLQLHEQFGNRAVQRMHESGVLQAKLKIGQPGDKYEHEADRVADRVMSMPDPVVNRQEEEKEEIQSQPLSDKITPFVRRSEDKEEEIQEQPAEKEKEEPQAKLLRQPEAEKEDEEVREKPMIQRQAEEEEKEEEEEPAQGKLLQQEAEEDEEVQKQPEEEEVVQKQPQDEEKEEVQGKLIQREEDKEEAQGKRLQCKGASDGSESLSSSTESSISQIRGGGTSLPESTRFFMEPRFSADFSNVRVHNDSRAHSLARSVSAKAFTLGSDVVFGQGQYAPDTSEGKQLMAHELTHVVQQGGAVRKKSLTISQVQPSIQRWSIKGIINKILSFIPGFTLVTVFLGKNPVTGDKVPQTGKMLMKGAMELIPVVGPILYGQLEESGTAERAGKWLDGKMKKLGLTIPLIKGLIDEAWDRMSIWKGISGNKKVIIEVFGPTLGKLVHLIRSIKMKVKEMILEGFLMMAGSAGKKVMAVFRKSKAALRKVIDNPMLLVNNFFKAVGIGFKNFKKNFSKHFKTALMEWIFGTMSKAGLQMPEKFNLAGIFSIVMQVLGLTYANIRLQTIAGIAKIYGKEKAEKAIDMVEQGVDFVKKIVTGGPIALWEMVKEKLSNFKEMVLGAILKWVRNTIIAKAMTKLISMLNPVGAIIQAAIMVYDVIMFFVNNWNRIKEIVTGIFNSLTMVALGQLGSAGTWIEKILAKGMTLMIAFLARLVGLGGIAKKVQEVMKKIRKPINAAIQKVVGVIVKLAKPIVSVIGKGVKKAKQAVEKAKQKGRQAVTAVKEKGKAVVKKGVEKAKGLFSKILKQRKKLKIDNERHEIWFKKEGKKYKVMMSSETDYLIKIIDDAKENHNLNKKQLEHLETARTKTSQLEVKFVALGTLEDEIKKLLASSSQRKTKEGQLAKLDIAASELSIEIVNSIRLALKGTKVDHSKKYLYEGMFGTYGTMIAQGSDDFTPDHQPQAAVIKHVASKWKSIKPNQSIEDIAKGHAKGGWSVNLHKTRHYKTRTYGKPTVAAEGRKNINDAVIRGKGKYPKIKTEIVKALLHEAEQDKNRVATEILGKKENDPLWDDVHKNIGDKKQSKKVINEITGRITSAEGRLTNQKSHWEDSL